MEAATRIELVMRVLQTRALPLGYAATIKFLVPRTESTSYNTAQIAFA